MRLSKLASQQAAPQARRLGAGRVRYAQLRPIYHPGQQPRNLNFGDLSPGVAVSNSCLNAPLQRSVKACSQGNSNASSGSLPSDGLPETAAPFPARVAMVAAMATGVCAAFLGPPPAAIAAQNREPTRASVCVRPASDSTSQSSSSSADGQLSPLAALTFAQGVLLNARSNPQAQLAAAALLPVLAAGVMSSSSSSASPASSAVISPLSSSGASPAGAPPGWSATVRGTEEARLRMVAAANSRGRSASSSQGEEEGGGRGRSRSQSPIPTSRLPVDDACCMMIALSATAIDTFAGVARAFASTSKDSKRRSSARRAGSVGTIDVSAATVATTAAVVGSMDSDLIIATPTSPSSTAATVSDSTTVVAVNDSTTVTTTSTVMTVTSTTNDSTTTVASGITTIINSDETSSSSSNNNSVHRDVGLELVEWAYGAVKRGRISSWAAHPPQASSAQGPASPPAAPPTPLHLNPVYPPSKGNNPRPAPLTVSFAGASSRQGACGSATGSLRHAWAATPFYNPLFVPEEPSSTPSSSGRDTERSPEPASLSASSTAPRQPSVSVRQRIAYWEAQVSGSRQAAAEALAEMQVLAAQVVSDLAPSSSYSNGNVSNGVRMPGSRSPSPFDARAGSPVWSDDYSRSMRYWLGTSGASSSSSSSSSSAAELGSELSEPGPGAAVSDLAYSTAYALGADAPAALPAGLRGWAWPWAVTEDHHDFLQPFKSLLLSTRQSSRSPSPARHTPVHHGHHDALFHAAEASALNLAAVAATGAFEEHLSQGARVELVTYDPLHRLHALAHAMDGCSSNGHSHVSSHNAHSNGASSGHTLNGSHHHYNDHHAVPEPSSAQQLAELVAALPSILVSASWVQDLELQMWGTSSTSSSSNGTSSSQGRDSEPAGSSMPHIASVLETLISDAAKHAEQLSQSSSQPGSSGRTPAPSPAPRRRSRSARSPTPAKAAGQPAMTREAALAAATAARRRSKWSKYDPFLPEQPLVCAWEQIGSSMLAIESVAGPMASFQPIQVMRVRGGQAFSTALADYQRMTSPSGGMGRLWRVHPGIAAWVKAAGHLASLQSSAGHRLGPVWALLLESPQHASLLSNASQGYAQFLRELERRHEALYQLLAASACPEHGLALLATLASWTPNAANGASAANKVNAEPVATAAMAV